MYPSSLQALIEAFRTLPGVGEKTAERYALMIAEQPHEETERFAQALLNVKDNLHRCSVCGNLTDGEQCGICKDTDRNHRQIFVVQSPKDVLAMEKTSEYNGVYHVLNGLISSSKGVMPEDLNLQGLLERAKDADEVILATSATMDGETTAMYLDRLLKKECPGILVTRIAHGLPAGGMLDYADEITLSHALSDRKTM
ncbi:MAG: recombination protein RecR [Solobacterium sp.]|jgi:recombination protein RecR|nr:recombination protein RecR [Solobacterium sp.]